ncbi:polymorphic toxin type 28 domain-containing protein [Enterobacter sp. 638]|uniref:Hemagglutinin-related protein n=1 Tax=Enterobacter sp. (strain 638) TaxID=399742 RepID=A0A9J9GDJ1_ENT38|nr:polymorphic toxin type 28 domain-containing protein [Enterobacter sp. 638]ABP58748.1 putative hemagglutinin-related protein [Enterobacter sp. 638]
MKNDSRYINADKEYGPGSDFWRATSGATGLIAGILGGNIQGGVAAGAAPYMAKLVKDATGENEAARIALHGIVSAALAEVQGGNGLAAAAGGMASAALMGNTLANAFYGKDVKDLDGEQRAFISNLATAVGAAAGGSVGGDTFSAASGANAARVEVENNSLAIPAPPPPVAGNNTGDAVNDANKTIASALDKKLKEMKEALDKATQCSFGRACSADDAEQTEGPNAGKNLTDAEKAEYGGAGSGTGTPPPPENDPKQQNEKPVEKLNQKQESAIKKIDNAIKNALKDHDVMGTLKDMDGTPVPKKNGGYWDHMQEMQNTLRGLRNHADTLKNINNPEAQAAYGRATDAINKIESALKGHGI